jgi:hypothetical protein
VKEELTLLQLYGRLHHLQLELEQLKHQFASFDAARAFYDTPEYQKAKAAREGAALVEDVVRGQLLFRHQPVDAAATHHRGARAVVSRRVAVVRGGALDARGWMRSLG